IENNSLPKEIDIVTALHACNIATDDAIDFALKHEAKYIVLVPCCQAEVAAILKKNRSQLDNHLLGEIWRHPVHAREFGSHITNVLRCLRLQAHGYDVTATELIGWEHSMKNELIIAKKISKQNTEAAKKLDGLIQELGLKQIKDRFMLI
ncbi:MAG: methyltransferase, partial [Burkholderiales bacterium]|nr:methyltransferase [Burkholderiales bacterium]